MALVNPRYRQQWVTPQDFLSPVHYRRNGRFIQELQFGTYGLKKAPSQAANFVSLGIGGAWEFSDGADDGLVAETTLPNNADTSETVRISLVWTSSTTSGNVVWRIDYLYTEDGDDLSAAAEGTLSKVAASPDEANVQVTTTFSDIPSPSSVDSHIKLRLRRVGTDEDDTLSDSAKLVAVTYKYACNKLWKEI